MNEPLIRVDPLVRIGLLSDTHDRLHQAAIDALGPVDMVIHLGDFCTQTILDELYERWDRGRVIAIRGNNDFTLRDLPTAVEVDWGLWRLFAIHDRLEASQRTFELPTIGLHGHTHYPQLDYAKGVAPAAAAASTTPVWLNPGPVRRPNVAYPSAAVLVQHADAVEVTWRFFDERRGVVAQADALIRIDEPQEPYDPSEVIEN